MPVNSLLPRSPVSPRYADSIRFFAYHCRVNVYQHSFFPLTVIPWNQLRLPYKPTELGWLQTCCPVSSQHPRFKVLRNFLSFSRYCVDQFLIITSGVCVCGGGGGGISLVYLNLGARVRYLSLSRDTVPK